MKRMIVFVSALFLLPAIAPAQQTSWQWVNPLPQGNLLNGVYAISKDTAFAVTELGGVLRTTNGGITWQVMPEVGGNPLQLFAVRFISSTTGWMTGEGGTVFKTTNCGESWSQQALPTQRDMYCVDFVSPTAGWIGGLSGEIYATTNGGATWTKQTTPTTQTIYGLNFETSAIGWAVGSGGVILKTTNGGVTWTPQVSTTTQTLYGVQFLSTSVGWVVGATGVVLRTVNGGSSWTPQVSGTTLSLFSVHFTSFLNGWAVGTYGEIIKSTNGGLSWFEQASGTYNDLYSVHFASATYGWAVGDLGTMLATTDGGVTWTQQSTGVKVTLNAITFGSITVGYSVGDEGTIVKSTNGGLTWAKQTTNLFQSLYGVDFIDDGTASLGWAVGDSAVILKTTNGGLTWLEQNSHTDPTLYSVHFVNSTNGWTCGDFGTILHTATGSGWTFQTTPTTTTLLGIRFANTSVGYCVGYGGTILKTTNGGLNWVEQTSNTSQTLYAIEIVDPNTVFITGDFGTVLKTTDGGTNWGPAGTGGDVSWYAISFYNATTGWVVGDDGSISKTTNAGASWTPQVSGTVHTLWGIQAVRGSSGAVLFASGIGGTILCSAVSPLPVKTWNGAFDSLWSAAGNWTPPGVPQKLDSVYIPVAPRSPKYVDVAQQVNLASLRIAPGAKLTIGSGLAGFVVKGNITLDGTLEMDPQATTVITTGGSFNLSLNAKFIPGRSTVVATGSGLIQGDFYNLLLLDSSKMQSAGKMSVRNNLTLMTNFDLRQVDTLVVYNRDPEALQGPGVITAGTIRRAIRPSPPAQYRFESPVTFLGFYPNGTLPDTVTMISHPNVLPPGLPDSIFAHRYYEIIPKGGSNYLTYLSLRYDSAEARVPIDYLAIFRDSTGIIFNLGRTDFLDSDYTAILLDSLRRFSSFYLGSVDYTPVHPLAFNDSLFITDAGLATDTLVFGAIPTASDAIEPWLGEAALGPAPSPGTFDARFIVPSTQATLVDFRDIVSTSHLQNLYTAKFQPGPGGYPMTFRWIPSALSLGTFFFRDAATHGGAFNINMKTQNSYVVTSSSVSQIEIIQTSPNFYNVIGGWNMLSLPVALTSDPHRSKLFPTATSNAFGFASSYYIADTLRNGVGYWLKFAAPQRLPVDGTTVTADTFDLADGWNMIGSITTPVKITSIVKIPPGVVGSTFYGYNNGYQLADTIKPFSGYWVKAAGAGKIILSSSGALAKEGGESPSEALRGLSTLTVTDRHGRHQELYVATDRNAGIDLDAYLLPPPPPDGGFDARFASGRLVEAVGSGSSSLELSLRSDAYPVTLAWRLDCAASGVTVRDSRSHAALAEGLPSADGSTVIHDPTVASVVLEFTSAVQAPREFALRQNYPNPFNPSTTIAFDLPAPSRVTLTVMNVLGQEVASLADQQPFAAGEHRLTFDASALSTGVYFYRLTAVGPDATQFHQLRKMLLMR